MRIELMGLFDVSRVNDEPIRGIKRYGNSCAPSGLDSNGLLQVWILQMLMMQVLMLQVSIAVKPDRRISN
ncbi:MAG: hypothetical protein AAGA40_12945 [Cyanobacteria bacterium P01_E01_bin.45]